jgi:eukaryotic-like serine/threonine-protein kinase
MERVVTEREPDPPSLAAARNGVPAPRGGARAWADLDAICRTAMHKDKTRRYEDVRALIDDIDRYQRTKPLEARRKTIGYRTRKFVARNWRALATTGAVAATMIVMAGLFIFNLARARDEALAAAARASRIQKFTSDLFKGGDPEMPPADLRVTTLVENGIRDAEGLDNEPEVQAELYHTLGTITQNLGDFAGADTLVTRALDQRRGLFRREHPQVAESLIALGLIRMDQVRLPHAEELVRKGLEILRRQRPLQTEAVADALTSLGRVLDQRGEHKEAIEVLDEAVALQSASSGPVSQQLADTLTALANAHHQAGDFKRADELNLRVLAIDRERFGEKHVNVANDLINIGASLHERGHHREAEQYYRQALPITEEWYKAGHVEIASNLRGLAGTLVPQERLDEARTLLERALAMDERTLPADHPRIALSVHAMGNFSYRRGDYDDAEARYRRALDMFRRKYGDDHNRTTTAKSTLATVAIKRGNFTEADTLLRDVIPRFERTTPGHVNIGINRVKLGRSLVMQRRYREAIAESLAGYQNLVKQMNPSAPWLQDARKDLVTAYEALNEPERAAPFRRELEQTAAAPAPPR